MAKIIIGFAGEIASGKTTAARHVIKMRGARAYKFSTPLRDVADRLGLEQSRGNLATLSTQLRAHFGDDLFAKIITKDVQGSDSEVIVIDGVRRLSDITYLKDLPEFRLIYMKATMNERYERITKRGENTDDLSKTFDDFKKDNEAEAELQIKELESQADLVIENDGNIEHLYSAIDTFIDNAV